MSRHWIAMLVVATSLGAVGRADAHLMPAGRGTLNLVGNKAYIVVSLPVTAFDGVPSCADGVLTSAELAADRELLRDSLRAGLALDTGEPAIFGEILLNLPTGYDHGHDKSGDVIAMIVAKLSTPAKSATLSWRHWPPNAEPLKIQGTISEGGRTVKREVGLLSPAQPSHRFFASSDEILTAWLGRGIGHLLGGVDHVVFVLTLLMLGVLLGRWRLLLGLFVIGYVSAMVLAVIFSLAPPASFVEVVIALSIVGCGVLALLRTRTRKRTFEDAAPLGHARWWPMGAYGLFVVLCGLAHGFGFSEVLVGDTHLPVLKLVGFNVGAAGGLTVLATVVVILCRLVTASPGLSIAGTAQLAGATACALGVLWTTERVIHMTAASPPAIATPLEAPKTTHRH